MLKPKQIPYGVKDFKRIRLEGYYYVDKTSFISALEERASFLFFVRPRRFGKTLLCEMLRCYYDVVEKENFSKLFGGLAIGVNPTKFANRYVVLSLDFSRVRSYAGTTWEQRFESYIDAVLRNLIFNYRKLFATVGNVDSILLLDTAAAKYEAICAFVRKLGLGLYVIVDEYDNFTNEIIASPDKSCYQEITHGMGFYRGWFKMFKATCDRIFMTGVSPVTMDDLTSGFNIATNISQSENFHAMVGFTQLEVKKIFDDFLGCGRYMDGVEEHFKMAKDWYDGYCFVPEKCGLECLFNCDMVLYYLSELVATGYSPRNLIDVNIRSDWEKLNAILRLQHYAENNNGILPLTEELAQKDEVTFNLVTTFPIEDICKKVNFKSLYYYYGIVTMGRIDFDEIYFRVPNECVRRQIFEYLRECYSHDNGAVDLEIIQNLYRGLARDGEWYNFFNYLAEKYREVGVIRDSLEGEARLNGFLRAYLSLNNWYQVKPEFELNGGFSDYVLVPNMYAGMSIPKHSYIIELKYSKVHATETEITRKHNEAVEQLKCYAMSPKLVDLIGSTTLHLICFEFRGHDLIKLEEVDS